MTSKRIVRVTFPVNPTSRENVVGFGITFGCLVHSVRNRHTIFSQEKSDLLSLTLLLVHLSSYVLILGTFLYQLAFFLFRHYNQKFMTPTWQLWLERLIQFMFGLCFGGYLIYSWDFDMSSSSCIASGYCPPASASAFMRRTVELKLMVCQEETGTCSDIFYKFPAIMQTFKSIVAAGFVIILWEKGQPISISITKVTN